MKIGIYSYTGERREEYTGNTYNRESKKGD
jgi:hypothetical protein